LCFAHGFKPFMPRFKKTEIREAFESVGKKR
jgi:hypothetical protein